VGALLFALAVGTYGTAADGVIPEKTRINLQLNNHLSTRSNSEGDTFTAYVTTPVIVGDRVLIPKGSLVNGSVSRILRPGRFKGKAAMNVIFHSITIPGLGQLPIVASLVGIDSLGRVSNGSQVATEGVGAVRNDVGRVYMVGSAGSAIGTLAETTKGAAMGAGVGASMGWADFFSTRGREIEIRKGAMLDIVLDQPLVIPREIWTKPSANK